jgi:ribosome-associated protein
MDRIMIEINENLRIPDSEIEYIFSPSSKPGGQKVNKTSTRVTLVFDVERSASISDEERVRIRRHLRTRISKDGLLKVTSQKHRSQHANRDAALERFADLLRDALKKRRKRKKTAVPHEARERRLKEKRRRARVKRTRSGVPDIDD